MATPDDKTPKHRGSHFGTGASHPEAPSQEAPRAPRPAAARAPPRRHALRPRLEPHGCRDPAGGEPHGRARRQRPQAQPRALLRPGPRRRGDGARHRARARPGARGQRLRRHAGRRGRQRRLRHHPRGLRRVRRRRRALRRRRHPQQERVSRPGQAHERGAEHQERLVRVHHRGRHGQHHQPAHERAQRGGDPHHPRGLHRRERGAGRRGDARHPRRRVPRPGQGLQLRGRLLLPRGCRQRLARGLPLPEDLQLRRRGRHRRRGHPHHARAVPDRALHARPELRRVRGALGRPDGQPRVHRREGVHVQHPRDGGGRVLQPPRQHRGAQLRLPPVRRHDRLLGRPRPLRRGGPRRVRPLQHLRPPGPAAHADLQPRPRVAPGRLLPDQSGISEGYFYFFFWTNDAGETEYAFSKTYEEHQQAIAANS